MRYRKLGKTNIEVSEVGFGALGIGGVGRDIASYGPTDDEESFRALKRAYDLGITFYDTAPSYGNGHSEEILGRAFHGMRDKVVLASKVGFVSLERPNDLDAIRGSFSPGEMRRSLEGSLRRLETDYLDLLQLHDPVLDVLRSDPEILETLAVLQQEGKIRAFGVSLKSPAEGAAAINEFDAPAIQINFNMIDQRALENGLLDLAQARGVGVVARTPFNYGFLTGKYSSLQFDPQDHRARWPEAQLKVWAQAPELFLGLNRGKTRTPAQLALQFCLSHPAISTVIPGMLSVREVDENVSAIDADPITPDETEAIRAIYSAHDFFIKRKSAN